MDAPHHHAPTGHGAPQVTQHRGATGQPFDVTRDLGYGVSAPAPEVKPPSCLKRLLCCCCLCCCKKQPKVAVHSGTLPETGVPYIADLRNMDAPHQRAAPGHAAKAAVAHRGLTGSAAPAHNAGARGQEFDLTKDLGYGVSPPTREVKPASCFKRLLCCCCFLCCKKKPTPAIPANTLPAAGTHAPPAHHMANRSGVQGQPYDLTRDLGAGVSAPAPMREIKPPSCLKRLLCCCCLCCCKKTQQTTRSLPVPQGTGSAVPMTKSFTPDMVIDAKKEEIRLEKEKVAAAEAKGQQLSSQIEHCNQQIKAVDWNYVKELEKQVQETNSRIAELRSQNEQLEGEVTRKLLEERQRAHSEELEKCERLRQGIEEKLAEERRLILELQQDQRNPAKLEAQLADLENKTRHFEAELFAVQRQEQEVHAQLQPLEESHRGHLQRKETYSQQMQDLQRKVQEHDALEAVHQTLVTNVRHLEGQVSVTSQIALQLETSHQACNNLQMALQKLQGEERQARELEEARNAEVKMLTQAMDLLQEQMKIFQEPDQEIEIKLLAMEQKNSAISGQISVAKAEINELKRVSAELQEAEVKRERFQVAQAELQEVKNVIQAQHAQLQGSLPGQQSSQPQQSQPDSPVQVREVPVAELPQFNAQASTASAEPSSAYALPRQRGYVLPAPTPVPRVSSTRAAPKAGGAAATVPTLRKAGAAVPPLKSLRTLPPGATSAAYGSVRSAGTSPPVSGSRTSTGSRGASAPSTPITPGMQSVPDTDAEASGVPQTASRLNRQLTRTQEQAMLDRLTRPRGRR